MRPAVSIVCASAIAAACSQVLGIDGDYSPGAEHAAAVSDDAPPAHHDAGAAGTRAAVTPAMPTQGGAGGAVSDTLGPPPFDPSGGSPVVPRQSDAGHPCPAGEKWCGECVPIDPTVGCDGPSCHSCVVTDSNAEAACGSDGLCDMSCNAGYMRVGPRCDRIPGAGGAATSVGSGGSSAGGSSGDSAGGTPGSGGSVGTGGGDGTCKPALCPNCSRGFEGCCIPAAPEVPSRCGCFYFPPLCTLNVG